MLNRPSADPSLTGTVSWTSGYDVAASARKDGGVSIFVISSVAIGRGATGSVGDDGFHGHINNPVAASTAVSSAIGTPYIPVDVPFATDGARATAVASIANQDC